MREIFERLAATDGVAPADVIRALGLSWPVEQRLVDEGALERPAPGVLRSTASAATWRQRVRIASLAPGGGVISHGAASRLHGLDGYDRYDGVDVLCRKGWWPNSPDETITHFTRGLTNPVLDVVKVDGIRSLTVGATLTLLSATDGIGKTAKALDSALRNGSTIRDLRSTAERWSRRGRSGPRVILMLLDERDGLTLPASWFQRLAKRLLEGQGLRFLDEYPVRSESGELLARLDLANPELMIGIECQSWRWHATPEAQHRDARRKGMLRKIGWEIIDVWWRDLDNPNRVREELVHLIQTRRQLSA